MRFFPIKCPTEMFAISVINQYCQSFTCDGASAEIYIQANASCVRGQLYWCVTNVSDKLHRRNIGQHLHDQCSRSLKEQTLMVSTQFVLAS